MLAEHIRDFYICSLSLPLGDLQGPVPGRAARRCSIPTCNDERFVSSFAVFHQRYSTNTWPSWRLAQPFRMLAHNGEINTLRGNLNWMKSHETRMVAPAFGAHNEEIKPLVQAGSSDSAALDAVVEALVRAGRSLPLVKTLLIPPAWSNKMAIPQEHRTVQLLQLRHGAVGRAGRAGRDRRPLGDRRHGPQRPAADALCAHRRRPAGGRLRDRHGAARGGADRREGPGRPGRDDRRRPAGRHVLPRPAS